MRDELYLITLKDYNPYNKSNPMNDLIYVEFLGMDRISVVDNEVLYAIIDVFKEEGEKEIIKMADRGQVFLSQARRVLGEEAYDKVCGLVPCVWDDDDGF